MTESSGSENTLSLPPDIAELINVEVAKDQALIKEEDPELQSFTQM